MEKVWPKMDDISQPARTAFKHWLRGSQVPVNADGSDAYYQHDYDSFIEQVGEKKYTAPMSIIEYAKRLKDCP